MTLLDRILERGFEMPLDPIMAARLERHMKRIKPDPLFQRRLRGQVVNRYVATREGMVAATRPVRLPRRGLSVLGRGMLYASLFTAVSATAVGAAAQGSLPGDLLYGVKLELESIRIELAPASLRDDLAAMALDERLDEVEGLAAAGRWEQVEAAVAAVERARAMLAELTNPSNGGAAATGVSMDEHLDRLAELITSAPDAEKRGLLRALAGSGGSETDTNPNRGPSGNGGQRKDQQAVPTTPTSSPAATSAATPPPEPTPSSAPTASPDPDDQPGGGQGGPGGKGGSGQLKANGANH